MDYLINNALPLMKGIGECSDEEFNYALRVGVTADVDKRQRQLLAALCDYYRD